MRLWKIAVLVFGVVAAVWVWQQWMQGGPSVIAATEAVEDAHKNADGSWKYSNHLVGESSPYLLLHAHNPVEWYPWGEEALARARREDKPIFLSVGYSTCYWCHVMERQVFSNPQIAALMNASFINIKVDREERPDIDRIYMVATHLINRHGGWPNSIFLTPALEPFFAGTYFPPEDMPGRPGFPRVLETMRQQWSENRSEVERIAAELTQTIIELEAGQQAPPMSPDSVVVNRTLSALRGRYDGLNGGFGGSPKFPPAMRLELLMADEERMRDELLRRIVLHSLEAMANGGLFDQVGGGFHRYATDVGWKVPHFEKMLYNQAHLTRLYVRAYALTGELRWRKAAERVLAFVAREMTSAEGAFYSALDAETEAEEGKYYLWTEDELAAALGEDLPLFMEVYGLAPMPEGEAGVLYVERMPEEVAEDKALGVEELYAHLDDMRSVLLKARSQRAYPLLDDKSIAAWNGLMIAAYARAYEVLGNEQYRRAAERAAEFVWQKMRREDGGLWRVQRTGVARHAGYLDDYAFVAHGLLALHQATEDARWLVAARALVEQMLTRFWDEADGGFFFSEADGHLIVRSKSAQDSALPSGNAVAVHALLDLAAATGEGRYRELAERALRTFGGMMRAQPGGFVHMVAAAERVQGGREAGATLAAAPSDSLVLLHVQLVERALGRLHIEAQLDIRAGWHIGANPARSDFAQPTSLTINADWPLKEVQIKYPPGRPLVFAALGETLSVYDGRVVLNAEIGRDAGASGELRLLVQYQACNDVSCLPPAELVYTHRLTK